MKRAHSHTNSCRGRLLLFAVVLLDASSRTATAFISPQTLPRVHSLVPNKLHQQSDTRHHYHAKPSPLFLLEKDSDSTLLSSSSSSSSSYGVLLSTIFLPAAKVLNDATGGYALTYADCSPENETTLIGRAFLATNVAYTLMGLVCLYYGDVWFGAISEAASVASFIYHYNQLSNPQDAAVVRLVLTIDYLIAFCCLGTALFYVLTDPMAVPFDGYVACALSVLFLGLSWIWEAGAAYCIFHGMWHLLGAYGGYLIGQAHATVTSMVA